MSSEQMMKIQNSDTQAGAIQPHGLKKQNLFHKILIANRGEIAVRVICTARKMGYRTVAVYSEADKNAAHVLAADQAVCVGPASVSESYLMIDNIIAAAHKTQADAIHPGYGFLSENPAFARACAAAGIQFIGPDASAIELMGSKRLSKVAMLDAGVPCIPGYQGAEQSDQVLIEKAADVGFPIMVKASAGGGGRGMRLVTEQGELAAQIKTARSEALSAFGSGELILERAVLAPRHIEIQIFADSQGNTVYLGERDCSIQRRHQKVVEEAPSPFVDEGLRERMGQAAVSAAKACGYRGAGTVEFLVDSDKNFYFLEMNTRLQVEHPVTELITGLDLVEWQLRVAAGEMLPLTQEDVSLNGHAIEVRLYAEDPRQNFMPQTGNILVWQYPEREGIRVDHGIHCGDTVSAHYDPMLAKVIAFGPDRATAARRLASAIEDIQLVGVNTNRRFLLNVLRHPAFINAEATT
ncbi:MAG: acetyl-CoA carboxylase biotin carboxylase subunit, partial [Paraglaciecola chathamensis]